MFGAAEKGWRRVGGKGPGIGVWRDRRKCLSVRRSSSLYKWAVLDQLQIKCMQTLAAAVRLPEESKSAWRSTKVAKKVGGIDPREVLVRQNLLQ